MFMVTENDDLGRPHPGLSLIAPCMASSAGCSPVMRTTTRATRTTHRSLTFESPQRQKHIRGGLMLRGFREEADTLEIQGEVSQLFSALWQPL